MTILEYYKTGGFAGLEQVLRIEGNGTVYFQGSLSGTPEYDIKTNLDIKQFQEVIDLIKQADIFSLQDEYKTKEHTFDAFSYQVTYRETSKEKSIKVESINDMPERLRLLLVHLDTIIQHLVTKTTN